MPLMQISIFLENSPGRLFEVTKAFGEAGVNLRALSLQESSGFGVLRLLVSDVAAARRIAMERQWPARVDEVAAAAIPDRPGSLAEVLTPLLAAGINVEYMYAFTGQARADAVMIFRFQPHAEGMRLLRESGVKLLNAEAFGAIP